MRSALTLQTLILKPLIVLGLSAWVCLSALAQSEEIDPVMSAAISDLIEVTGALRIGEQFAAVIAEQMSASLSQNSPDLPARTFDIVRDEVFATINSEMESGSFKASIVPVYARHFTLREVRGLIAFYQTPLGQKTLEVMPQLTQESMQIAQSWGAAIGPVIGQRVTERLAAEGIVLD